MRIRFAFTASVVPLVLVTVFAASPLMVAAQQPAPIERIKMTDGEASCAQLYAETGDMDKAIAAAQASQSSGNSTAMAGNAANLAAEVADRTGLFGQFGGVAGALFGKTAAQTAAGVAQQSGQMTAAQSTERIRQATARKEHVTGIFVARGCRASDPNFNPATTTQSNAAVVAAMQITQGAPGSGAAGGRAADPEALQKLLAPVASVTALPELDPDQHFKGKMGGTFGKDVVQVMPNGKRVAVAGFRVVFITENTATAQVRASYMPGRDTSGASSSLRVVLNGVDQTTMQQITDKAYADFLAQLKFAGREVVPAEELKEFLSGIEVTGRPYTASTNGQAATVLSPTGMPLWFSNWDQGWGDKGPLNQTNFRRVSEYSAKHKAVFIAPLIVVNFVRMSSSGNQSGFVARSAETGAAMSMHVAAFGTTWTRADESRGGITMGGDEGGISMAAPIVSTLEFGSLKEVAASDNSAVKGVFDILGQAAGLANAGGANRSKSENVAETSGPAYAAAAVDALGRATGTFAKWFQKYPAK